MGRPGRNAKGLPGVRGHHIEDILHAAVEAFRIDLGSVRVAAEARQDAGVGAGAQDIPEFLLAQEIVALRGGLVVRMDPERHAAAALQ